MNGSERHMMLQVDPEPQGLILSQDLEFIQFCVSTGE